MIERVGDQFTLILLQFGAVQRPALQSATAPRNHTEIIPHLARWPLPGPGAFTSTRCKRILQFIAQSSCVEAAGDYKRKKDQLEYLTLPTGKSPCLVKTLGVTHPQERVIDPNAQHKIGPSRMFLESAYNPGAHDWVLKGIDLTIPVGLAVWPRGATGSISATTHAQLLLALLSPNRRKGHASPSNAQFLFPDF